MATRGRKSLASTLISAPLAARLQPPAEMPESQREIWIATVNARPAEWFGPEHAAMLTQYVRHIETSAALTAQIEKFDPSSADPAYVTRFDRLMRARVRETGAINALARSMRLTHQSLYAARKAGTLAAQAATPGKAGRPWETTH